MREGGREEAASSSQEGGRTSTGRGRAEEEGVEVGGTERAIEEDGSSFVAVSMQSLLSGRGLRVAVVGLEVNPSQQPASNMAKSEAAGDGDDRGGVRLVAAGLSMRLALETRN